MYIKTTVIAVFVLFMLMGGYMAWHAVKERMISSHCQSEAAQELKALGIC